MTIRKSSARKLMEDITGGPLLLQEVISAIRLGDGLNQTEFAEKLGISRSHLCDIEHGRKNISPKRAVEFAKLLGYSADQFLRLALQQQVNELDNITSKYQVELKLLKGENKRF